MLLGLLHNVGVLDREVFSHIPHQLGGSGDVEVDADVDCDSKCAVW